MIYLFVIGDVKYKNPNIDSRDRLVGRLTKPHPVLQVFDEVLDPHRRLSLAQVRVDPVHKGLPLDTLLLI